MPKIFIWNGYKFFFFSTEGNPPERCHIHIRKAGNIAKFWIIPEVGLASVYGMNAKELNILEKIVIKNKDLIQEKWNEHINN